MIFACLPNYQSEHGVLSSVLGVIGEITCKQALMKAAMAVARVLEHPKVKLLTRSSKQKSHQFALACAWLRSIFSEAETLIVIAITNRAGEMSSSTIASLDSMPTGVSQSSFPGSIDNPG